jgi:hypothetical protein
MQAPQQPRKPQQPLASHGEPHPRDELKNVQQNCQQSIRHVPHFGTPMSAGRLTVLTYLTDTTGHCRPRAVRGLGAPAPSCGGGVPQPPLPGWHDSGGRGLLLRSHASQEPEFHHAPRPSWGRGALAPIRSLRSRGEGPPPPSNGGKDPFTPLPGGPAPAQPPRYMRQSCKTGVSVYDPGRRPAGRISSHASPGGAGRDGRVDQRVPKSASSGVQRPTMGRPCRRSSRRIDDRRVLEPHERGIQVVPPGTGGARGC